MGYWRAGFDVVGLDVKVQPYYPFPDAIQGDALRWLADVEFVRGFDVVHASPPCQRFSPLNKQWKRSHPDLIAPVRSLLQAAGVPYVIENVPLAPLDDLYDLDDALRGNPEPVMLCGSMFGLGYGGATLRRHRHFESSTPLADPPPDSCKGRRVVGVYGTGGAWTRVAPGGGGVKVAGRDSATALGIDWTVNQAGLSQAIPPAYTEWIGRQLIHPANHPGDEVTTNVDTP